MIHERLAKSKRRAGTVVLARFEIILYHRTACHD
jgi:hypothetical protein